MARKKKKAGMDWTPVMLVGIGAVGFVAITKMWMKVTGVQRAQEVLIRQQAELIVDVDRLKQEYGALGDDLSIIPLPEDENEYVVESPPIIPMPEEEIFIGDAERDEGERG